MNERSEFGRVRINRGSRKPETSNLPYPTNRIVGVLESKDSARRAIERLGRDGIAETDIDLFFGGEGAAWFHTFHHRSGLLGRLWQLVSFGDEQQQSREYEQAIRDGHVVVVVRAPREDCVATLQEALEQEGGTRLRYFGRWTVRDLSFN